MSGAADPVRPTPRLAASAGRLLRLVRKELRETLRDRRTIVTLVLMPLLLYPLMSIGLKQLFSLGVPGDQPREYRLGVRSQAEGRWLSQYLALRIPGEGARAQPLQVPLEEEEPPHFTMLVKHDVEEAVRKYEVDVGILLRSPIPPVTEPSQSDLLARIEFLVREDAIMGKEALAWLEQRLAWCNASFLAGRLRALGVSQPAIPVYAETRLVKVDDKAAAVSLVALVPLVLILMTITGAVYPAIDLTAGERERGTLEVLVAAPVPRLSLLVAKYAAVLVVALLTAVVNLSMMTATLLLSGLGPLLFGDAGLTPLVAVQVLGLLVLFAAFFSAVMLTLTSFARSFKEAQAYLVPLMVAAIAPGVAGLLPGLRLTGPLAITPLLNIVLLGRDLLEHRVEAGMALLVVVSTLLYTFAAIGVAARVFAAEAVLYSSETGWADLFRRPSAPQPVPTLASAMFSLALVFPLFLLALQLIAAWQTLSVGPRLLAASLATSLLFAVIPLAAARWRRFRIVPSFRLARPCTPWAWPAAAVLGLSLWAFAHEAVVWQSELGLVTLGAERLRQAAALVEAWRRLPVAAVVAAMALVPAVCEELFFRGYLFSALAARSGARTAVLASAAIFGIFHVVGPGAIVIERLLPSTFLGLVLGWLAWRSGSVLPGMLLHALHNGFLVLVAYYQPQLKSAGWGVEEQAHLPLAWLGAAGLMVAAGAALLAGRGPVPRDEPQAGAEAV